MLFDVKTVNKLLGIDESYKAPEKMLTADKDLSKTGVLVAKLKMKIKEKENG